MYNIQLTKEEFMALWDGLYKLEQQKKDTDPKCQQEDPHKEGFESLKEKIGKGPHHAVQTNTTAN